MTSWTFVSRDPEETRAIARELGRSIGADGAVLALVGPLGAGKTVFVKGLAEGLGLDPRSVSSPTFVIAQQYPLPEGAEVLHHIDLYRLEDESELVNIGFEDMLAPGGVLAVEWADRFPGVLGREYVRIDFEGPTASEAEGTDSVGERPMGPGRRAVVTAVGRFSERVAADWFDRVEARADGGAETGGFERLAALVMLLVAGLGVLVGGAETLGPASFAAGAPCSALVERAADDLGTTHAVCSGAASRAARTTGVARLVNGDRIDVNRAPGSWLETLPGVGPARAAAIVAARSESPFRSVRELELVPGIGPVTRERLSAFVEVVEEEEVRDGRG